MKYKKNKEINLSIFRSYDIRGIYPSKLDEKVAYKIGRAFAIFAKAKKVAVGRDMRLSSPVLSEALIKGITDQGVDVYDIGQVPVECVYFIVGGYDYGAGVAITASHNPKEYNGFKLVKREGRTVRVVPGEEIKEMVEIGNFSDNKNKGEIRRIDIWQNFLNHIFSFIDAKKIKPFKIIIDAGNGMAGKAIPMIEKKLPIKIIPLNFNLDGNFPAHPPNPLLKESTVQISREIKSQNADFGVIFDGDADRIFLLDEKGEFIRADITLLLLAKYFLKKYPGKGVAYNLICSKAVPEFIKEWGGKPIRTKVGFVNVQRGILENNGIMGGELSGHYSFKDNFYLDSGFISFLVLLEIISESERKVSELVKDFSPYAKAAEINFEVSDKEKILKKIRKKYSNGKQDFLDGITVEYSDWWFNIRPSQTEPFLRLTIEAKTQPLLEEKKNELVGLIGKIER
ncbi:MAG: Phosphomannomutase [Parcubacteria group bacterium GW2011_GWA2_38_27]|nr:MAG: Phosphomannomutase [Parcubacteria group bacterium GW2011_GWA2_38_27]